MKVTLNHIAALAIVAGTVIACVGLTTTDGEALAAALASAGGVFGIAGTISGRTKGST